MPVGSVFAFMLCIAVLCITTSSTRLAPSVPSLRIELVEGEFDRPIEDRRQ